MAKRNPWPSTYRFIPFYPLSVTAFSFFVAMPSQPQQVTFFGPQANSLKESAPSIGFGTAKRGNAMQLTCMHTPGPIYDARYSSKTGGNYSFGTGPGAGASSSMRPDSARTPGPGEYEVRQLVLGQSKTSLFRNVPSYGMGKPREHGAGRSCNDRTCGPAKFYSTVNPIGNQIESTKKTPAAFSFGSAQRFGGVRTDLMRGAFSPGPGSYRLVGTTGALSVESTNKTNPAYRFGYASRFADSGPMHRPPGPKYQVRPSTGPQLQSTMRSGQAYSFGSSQRFGKAYAALSPGIDSPGPGSYNA